MAFPEQPAARTALDNALAPYVDELNFYAYTQAELDQIRIYRNAVELAAYNFARAAGGDPVASAPRPVATPCVYPGIFPAITGPTDISGCKLYLTADVGVSSGPPAAFNVSAWADQSGNGNNTVSDNVDSGGLFRKAGGGTTARVYQTSGVGGCLKSASATRLFAPGSARTVFVVAQVGTVNDGCIFLDMQPGRSTPATTVAFGLWNATNLGVVYPATDGVSVSQFTNVLPATFENVKQIYAYRWPGYGYPVQFSAGGGALVNLSGSPIISEAGDNGFLVGRFYGTARHGSLVSSLHAIVAYDSFLPDYDCARVMAFLRDKWAL